MYKGVDFLTTPFRVIVDTREQTPYLFHDLEVKRGKKKFPLVVLTDKKKLDTGDYSIEGHEDKVTIERKSFEDAMSTFTQGHARFERELDRLQEMQWSAILLEFEWSRIFRIHSDRSINPRAIDGMIHAWAQRFPSVHWFWRPGRLQAEKAAVNILRRYWIETTGEKSLWSLV